MLSVAVAPSGTLFVADMDKHLARVRVSRHYEIDRVDVVSLMPSPQSAVCSVRHVLCESAGTVQLLLQTSTEGACAYTWAHAAAEGVLGAVRLQWPQAWAFGLVADYAGTDGDLVAYRALETDLQQLEERWTCGLRVRSASFRSPTELVVLAQTPQWLGLAIDVRIVSLTAASSVSEPDILVQVPDGNREVHCVAGGGFVLRTDTELWCYSCLREPGCRLLELSPDTHTCLVREPSRDALVLGASRHYTVVRLPRPGESAARTQRWPYPPGVRVVTSLSVFDNRLAGCAALEDGTHAILLVDFSTTLPPASSPSSVPPPVAAIAVRPSESPHSVPVTSDDDAHLAGFFEPGAWVDYHDPTLGAWTCAQLVAEISPSLWTLHIRRRMTPVAITQLRLLGTYTGPAQWRLRTF